MTFVVDVARVFAAGFGGGGTINGAVAATGAPLAGRAEASGASSSNGLAATAAAATGLRRGRVLEYVGLGREDFVRVAPTTASDEQQQERTSRGGKEPEEQRTGAVGPAGGRSGPAPHLQSSQPTTAAADPFGVAVGLELAVR